MKCLPKISSTAILLLALSLILLSCGQEGDEKNNDTTPSSADTSTPEDNDPDYSRITESTETWLKEGLDAYLFDDEITVDAAEFFSEQGNLNYLALYNHLFLIEHEKTSQAAAFFFRYVIDNHGYDALFDLDKRIEYKDEFLKSLDPSLNYPETKEAELLFSEMICEPLSKDHPCALTLRNVVYYIPHEALTDLQAFGNRTYFIYRNTFSLESLKAYLHEIDPAGECFDTTRELQYHLTLDMGINYTDEKTNEIDIADYRFMLREAVNALSICRSEQNVWLSEGLAHYLGLSLGFDSLFNAEYIMVQYMSDGLSDERIAKGDTNAVFYKKLTDYYIEKGGKYDSADVFDPALYLEAAFYAEQETGTRTTLKEIYHKLERDTDFEGNTMTYPSAACFTEYLINTYSISDVLAVYKDYSTFEAVFGDSFENLYNTWLEQVFD